MIRKKLSLFAAALAAVAAVASSPAAAQSTWNYSTFTQNAANFDNFGNSYASTQSGNTLTVRAFANTGSGATFATANIGNWGAGSGFGVRNQIEGLGAGSPQHAMDNSGSLDMLALNFTSNVVITSLTTGWSSNDSDISLLRWDGAGTPTITGRTQAQLLSSGWTLVNHYSNMTDDVARNTGLTAQSTASSWWLISAYNSGWGGSALDGYSDYVKVLASVTALPSGGLTPEPGSLALAAAALLGTFGLRRRASKGRRA